MADNRLEAITNVEIVGTGFAVPSNEVTNEALREDYGLDTTDEWIQTRTGNKVRYTIDGTEATNTSLSVGAAEMALTAAGIQQPYGVDNLILATSTPDKVMPATATLTAVELGITGGSYDLNAACAGFVYALTNSYRSFKAGGVSQELVIGSDPLSRIVDWEDRATAILFGDGAGAAVLRETQRDEAGLLSWHTCTDPSSTDILYCEQGKKIQMEGREVYRRAIPIAEDVCRILLEKTELDISQVDVFIPHQANQRITYKIAENLDLPPEKVVSVIHEYANTSAASIPIALHDALQQPGRIKRGDVIMLVGFGAGLTAAGALIRY